MYFTSVDEKLLTPTSFHFFQKKREHQHHPKVEKAKHAKEARVESTQKKEKGKQQHHHNRGVVWCGGCGCLWLFVVVVVVVVVLSVCFTRVLVHSRARMHLVRVAEHLGVKTPGVPATHDPALMAGATLFSCNALTAERNLSPQRLKK